MSSSGIALSTAEARRPIVTAAALRTFARGGYHGTTVADVAREAKISPAYVFKLFPSKETLFVAALELCFDRRSSDALALRSGRRARPVAGGGADAMGEAYADLIADRSLLMLQVHALVGRGRPGDRRRAPRRSRPHHDVREGALRSPG